MITRPQKVILIAGTRPEAIKLAPVIFELRTYSSEFRTIVCDSGQHDEMIRQVLDDFAIEPDVHLNVMHPEQSLSSLSARLFDAIDGFLKREDPDWVVVQGDTTTTMVAALSCFYNRIKLAHVEAGLRSYSRYAPFPEEINRRIVGLVADLHFAPTEKSRENLLKEGVAARNVVITGNTAIDALLWMKERIGNQPLSLPLPLQQALSDNRRLVLITGHRRESFGEGFKQICLAIKDLAESFPDAIFVYPVHLNPNVRKPVTQLLGEVKRVFLISPLSYRQFVFFMDRSEIIMTDSGGIQEEAPSLGKPVLVMRDVTERPEGVEIGVNRLVGANRKKIVSAASFLLSNPEHSKKLFPVQNPYGDGKAAQRIVGAIRSYSAELCAQSS